MTDKFSQKILEKIKSEKIAPRARFIFLAKNYGIWALAIVALFAAAIFVGTSIAELFEAEWELLPHFPGGQINFFAKTIPFFWLAGLVAAGALAFFLLRKTKRGYRFGMIALAGGILIASAAGGISLLSTDLPPALRDFRLQNFPPHFDPTEWQNPDAGFLFGEIVEIQNELFLLDALDQKIWKVDFAAAQLPSQIQFIVGDNIRAVGEKTGELEFEAERILPEMPQKMRGKMGERKMPARAY